MNSDRATETALERLVRAYEPGTAALADAVGCSLTTLYRLAKGGHRRPPHRLLRKVAVVLSVPASKVEQAWRRSCRE